MKAVAVYLKQKLKKQFVKFPPEITIIPERDLVTFKFS